MKFGRAAAMRWMESVITEPVRGYQSINFSQDQSD